MDVVMRIERSMGMGIIKVAQQLSEAEISTEQIINIILPVVRAGSNNVKEADLKKDIWEAGLVAGITACSEIVAMVLNAGNDEGNDQQVEDQLV